VARAEVLWPVEVANEKGRGLAVARIGVEVGVRLHQPLGLPAFHGGHLLGLRAARTGPAQRFEALEMATHGFGDDVGHGGRSILNCRFKRSFESCMSPNPEPLASVFARQQEMRLSPPGYAERRDALHRLESLILRNADAFCAALQSDFGAR